MLGAGEPPSLPDTPAFTASDEAQLTVPRRKAAGTRLAALFNKDETAESALSLTVIPVDRVVRHSEAVRGVERAIEASLKCETAVARRFSSPPTTLSVFLPAEHLKRARFDGHDLYFETDIDEIAAAFAGAPDDLCDLLFDRVFEPPYTSDKADSASFSASVASLRDAGMSFRHLGIDVSRGGTRAQALEALADEAGDTLARIEQARTPSAVVGALTDVHRVIVDHLGRMPPISLREAAAPPRHTNELEMDSLNRTSDRFEEAMSASIVDKASAAPTPAGVGQQGNSSADLLLPVLIYVILKRAPRSLVSFLNFTTRFAAPLEGEASYCLTNLEAVVAFVRETAAAAAQDHAVATPTAAALTTSSGTVRERMAKNVGHGVDEFVDTANKVRAPAAVLVRLFQS